MDENQPVDENEFVYRRIPAIFVNENLAMRVQREAFKPTENDATGISVFRAGLAEPTDALDNLDDAKKKQYFVARLAVSDLKNFGLTVVPDPLPDGPRGHAVIPELTWQAYNQNKTHWKELLVKLATLAGTDFVHKPG